MADCPLPPGDIERVTVAHVTDGDTLVLGDRTKVRLIGINTTELGTRGRPNEPLSIEARDRLRQWLFMADQKARLIRGADPEDNHGRTLAHLILPDGRNVAEALIRDGLGWMVAVDPNVALADCLATAEDSARAAHRGIWSDPDLAPVESTALKLRARGFKVVTGRITRVSDTGAARWLHLDGRFSARIAKDHLGRFKPVPDAGWVGRRVEIRGWLYATRGELHVNLAHPGALRTTDATDAQAQSDANR
jgi:endonuclease YncB( thermonuclease family)